MIELFDNLGFNSRQVDVKFWTFPAGERGVKIESPIKGDSVQIKMKFKNSDSLIDLLLVFDAVRRITDAPIDLEVLYFPYAQQDRVCNKGESFSLQVIANLINTLPYRKIIINDPHSYVLSALFPAGKLVINTQAELIKDSFFNFYDIKGRVLIAPDNGASKKIQELSKLTGIPYVEFTKVRSASGEVESTKCTSDFEKYIEDNSIRCAYVIDDICVKGGTFISLAKEVRKYYNAELNLYVTHGVFAAGKEELLKYFNNVEAVNSK